MTKEDIISKLPYGESFLFVDHLETITENGVTGSYTFGEDEVFYDAHFIDFPVTPGVILIECMAQIGLVCLGVFLLSEQLSEKQNPSDFQVTLSESEVEFLKPVFPKERVTVTSELVYFRFNKLKCKVKMTNSKGEVVCKGVLSGMLVLGIF